MWYLCVCVCVPIHVSTNPLVYALVVYSDVTRGVCVYVQLGVLILGYVPTSVFAFVCGCVHMVLCDSMSVYLCVRSHAIQDNKTSSGVLLPYIF